MSKLLSLEKFESAQKKHNFVSWIATKHHKTHKGYFLDFSTHPYQRQIYHDQSNYIVIIKSTQNGISEYLLVRAMAHAIQGLRVFYVLPTFELVKRFVDERYTKTVQHTPYYRMLVRAVREEMGVKQTESVKSKDIGNGNIAFVNSFSSIGFTEYPADEVIIDELDKCDQTNIKMAWERLSHSEYRRQTKISNPTFRKKGIDLEYRDTDRMEWHVYCSCGHRVNLDWFKHIVRETDDKRYVIRDADWTWNSNRDIYPICDKCGKPIDRSGEGSWIALDDGKRKRGYRLTKLFTGTVSIVEIMDRFRDGLKDDEELQRFYNADLGQAYTAQGATITEDMLQSCEKDYLSGPEDGMIIAGVDVGKFYHYVIKKMMPDGTMKTLLAAKTRDTLELISTLKRYKMSAGVIDALPETREAKKIANAFRMMFICYFGNTKKDTMDVLNKIITVQRTSAIDAVKESILTNKIMYPHNVLKDSEFIENMTSSVRAFNPDKRIGDQQGAYEWIEGDNPDHYLLATAYCLIARRLVVLLSKR